MYRNFVLFTSSIISGPDLEVGPATIDDLGVETSPGVLRGTGVFHLDHANEENRSGNGALVETGTDHITDITGEAGAGHDIGTVIIISSHILPKKFPLNYILFSL